MKEFQFENETYQVVPHEWFGEITHARLASGKIVDVYFNTKTYEKMCDYRQGIGLSCWKDLGIQALRRVTRKPRSFSAPFEFVNGLWKRSSPVTNENSVWFHCVEIMGENK